MAQPVDSSGNTASEQQAVSAVTAENAAAVAALLLLEKQAIEAVSGPLRSLLRSVFRVLAGRYVLMFGGLDRPADPVQAQQLTSILVTELENLRTFDPTGPLTDAAIRSAAQGAAHANRYLVDPVAPVEIQAAAPAEVQLHPVTAPLIPVDVKPLEHAPTPPLPTVAAVDTAVIEQVQAARQNIDQAVTAAQEFAEQTPVTGWDDVMRQMGKANLAAVNLERQTAWTISASNSAAIRRTAAERGARLLWVAEPDACVVCQALSGHLIDPASGEGFDEFATFGKPSAVPDVWPPGHPLMGPPRHVNCRCHPELWSGPAVEPGGEADTSLYNRPGVGSTVDVPAALRREAKRSIVMGWSVPSESGTVRLDAAARLLSKGAGLPKTVEAKGHAAVKAGKFENRTHPSLRRAAHRPK